MGSYQDARPATIGRTTGRNAAIISIAPDGEDARSPIFEVADRAVEEEPRSPATPKNTRTTRPATAPNSGRLAACSQAAFLTLRAGHRPPRLPFLLFHANRARQPGATVCPNGCVLAGEMTPRRACVTKAGPVCTSVEGIVRTGISVKIRPSSPANTAAVHGDSTSPAAPPRSGGRQANGAACALTPCRRVERARAPGGRPVGPSVGCVHLPCLP